MTFFYAVKNGLIPGVYTNWNDCKKQVDGFKGAKFKKFPSESEALDFIGSSLSEKSNNKKTTTSISINNTNIETAFTKTSNPVKRKNPFTNKDSTSKSTSRSANLNQHYLCSKDAEKNFYLDARHSNNLPKNNNEGNEPALKRLKKEQPTPVKIEFIPSDLMNNMNEKGDSDIKEKTESQSPINSLAKTCLIEYKINDKLDFNFNGKKVTVYTDGACSGNGQKNSAAAIGVFWGPSHPLNSGRKLHGVQTNNRAEITAAIISISQAIVYDAGELTLNTDSQFMIKCMESWIKNWKRNGWQTSTKQPVKNIDDLKRLDKLSEQIKINWVYCPGHKGVYGNEEADKLATEAIERY